MMFDGPPVVSIAALGWAGPIFALDQRPMSFVRSRRPLAHADSSDGDH